MNEPIISLQTIIANAHQAVDSERPESACPYQFGWCAHDEWIAAYRARRAENELAMTN